MSSRLHGTHTRTHTSHKQQAQGGGAQWGWVGGPRRSREAICYMHTETTHRAKQKGGTKLVCASRALARRFGGCPPPPPPLCLPLTGMQCQWQSGARRGRSLVLPGDPTQRHFLSPFQRPFFSDPVRHVTLDTSRHSPPPRPNNSVSLPPQKAQPRPKSHSDSQTCPPLT